MTSSATCRRAAISGRDGASLGADRCRPTRYAVRLRRCSRTASTLSRVDDVPFCPKIACAPTATSATTGGRGRRSASTSRCSASCRSVQLTTSWSDRWRSIGRHRLCSLSVFLTTGHGTGTVAAVSVRPITAAAIIAPVFTFAGESGSYAAPLSATSHNREGNAGHRCERSHRPG